MSYNSLECPNCGTVVKQFRNPVPTVDIIIEIDSGIILIERKNPPYGWALPGGFVDYGETLENAAIREAAEETSLHVTDLRLVGCYSNPKRDLRMHTISTVFAAKATGTPIAADDASALAVFSTNNLPEQLCFDHAEILSDYIAKKADGKV